MTNDTIKKIQEQIQNRIGKGMLAYYDGYTFAREVFEQEDMYGFRGNTDCIDGLFELLDQFLFITGDKIYEVREEEKFFNDFEGMEYLKEQTEEYKKQFIKGFGDYYMVRILEDLVEEEGKMEELKEQALQLRKIRLQNGTPSFNDTLELQCKYNQNVVVSITDEEGRFLGFGVRPEILKKELEE